jgi:hypothetical protein
MVTADRRLGLKEICHEDTREMNQWNIRIQFLGNSLGWMVKTLLSSTLSHQLFKPPP